MSGQTYTTTIRIPTPQELAQQAAIGAKNQTVAQGTASAGLEALQVVLKATSKLTAQVQGTVHQIGARSAEAEVRVRGTRVPVRVDVDPGVNDKATVRISFATADGLSCADEAKLMGEIATAMAAGGLNPVDPTSGAAAAPLPERTIRRERSL